MARFPFSEYGRVFIPIDIRPLSGITLRKTFFKVDTGADTTTISKKDLHLLTGFNYTFDNDDDIFSISRTKVFNPRYKFLPKQEINEIAIGLLPGV